MWQAFFAVLAYGFIATITPACTSKQATGPRASKGEVMKAPCLYKVGQAVELNSGGATMTIRNIRDTRPPCNYKVVWLNGEGELEGSAFSEKMLTDKLYKR